MRIIYISNSRVPTEKAYGVSIAKTCEALASKGAEVILLAPRVSNLSGNDIFSYYDVKKNFSVRFVPTADAVKRGWRYGFVVNQISFGLVVFFAHLFKKRNFVVLTRDEVSGFFLSLAGFSVYYDMHGFPERLVWLWKILLRPLQGIITTNEWKIEQCEKGLGIPRKKMIVARNGFDPHLFEVKKDREVLRRRLNLSVDKPIVLYTGHLYDWKGVYVLANSARLLPQVNFVFVGGTYYHIQDFKKKYADVSNIILLGHKPHLEIPFYLKAADALALPNSGKTLTDPRFSVYTRYDTSPIKMFEYMASGVPIVASDLPSIREILNEKNSVLVKPDNPEDLKRGIEKVLNDKDAGHNIAMKALEDVREYTWERRAERIMQFVAQKS